MFELFSGWLAVGFTLALLSYLIADNPVYRLAVNFFIGLTAGYAVVLAWHTVLRPQLVQPLLEAADAGAGPLALLGGLAAALPAGILGLLLLAKTVRLGGRAGTLVLALMLGVGAAVAVGGAVTGTLLPQTGASFVSLLPTGPAAGERAIEAIFTVVGTLATLAFFYYGARGEPGSQAQRPALLRPLAGVGQVFIGVAFGVMFAGALAASIAIFADTSLAMWSFIMGR
jgi:hypothetical protein